MTIVAVIEAVALVAVVFLLLRHAASQARLHAGDTAAWADERRELLNRIQRPDVVPLHPVPGFVVPEPEPDEIELVGTIAYPPDLAEDSE